MSKRPSDDTAHTSARTDKKRRRKTSADTSRRPDQGTEESQICCLEDAIAAKVVELPEGIPKRQDDPLNEDPLWNIVFKCLAELRAVRLSWLPSQDSSSELKILFLKSYNF
jgi:hypothetical protein